MTPYHESDGVTLYHGDCREILPQLGRFDLLLTDPPYGIGYGGSQSIGGTAGRIRRAGKLGRPDGMKLRWIKNFWIAQFDKPKSA